MGFESKKSSLLRILQTLQRYTDIDHMLTYDQIVDLLNKDYGLTIERKTVGRSVSLLNEAGFDIVTTKRGTYLASRTFEDAELRLLIDSVLASKHITPTHSKELIDKLCSLSNTHFRRHVKNIYSINDWNKTDNVTLFYNIDIVDEAIEKGVKVRFDYLKYGADMAQHKSAHHIASVYQMILHNQRYYLMGYNEMWDSVRFYRMDHISNMQLTTFPATPLREIDGYQNGIDYKKISSSLPYMYSDKPQPITFVAESWIIDHIIDWFGKDIAITPRDDNRLLVKVSASPTAMEYWAMQYLNAVEILSPASLRERIANNLKNNIAKYTKEG